MTARTNLELNDLLRLKFVDLVETSTLEFAKLLRVPEAPTEQHLQALNAILIWKVYALISDKGSLEALRRECDALGRLVPHAKFEQYNASPSYWASRWLGYKDLIGHSIRVLEATS